jgi:hypothetical protein
MRKKLVVILGAGSSIPRDMPSIADLDGLMRQWGQEWALERACPDYFDALWCSAEAYYQTANSVLRPPLNFEKVLGDMVALAHWMTPAPWGDTLRQIACSGAPPPDLDFATPSLHGPAPYGATVMVRDQLKHLLIALVRHMRRLCRDLDSTNDAARKYRVFFDALRRAFDVGIYNLNYDTAALTASPDAYTGFNESGQFDPSGIHQRAEWGFIYHLHGSVHHSLAGEFGDKVCWRRDLGDDFFDGHQGLSDDKRSEGRSFPKTTIIAGGFKLDQLLVEPFHSFHAALVRHVYAADAILLGGYGFGDVHINRALRNRLATSGDRPPVMVLDHVGDTTDPMEFRHDLWTHGLCAALGAASKLFLEPGHASPVVPAELAIRGSFEVARPHRVAVWYGGFIAAAGRCDDITSWLDGGADEVLIPPCHLGDRAT